MGSTYHHFRRSFSAGEIAPILRARGETDKIRTGGAATLRNMQVAKNGVAFNRAGTGFCGTVKDSNKATRIISWIFDDDDRYAIEVGDLYMRFWQDSARIVVSGVVAWSAVTQYEIGDIASLAGTNYYAKQRSLNKTPPDTDYWYALSGTIFEIPTPYTQAQVFDLTFAQSFDVVWIAHPSHPPHELIRYGNTDWTLLPMHFGPSVPPPTGLALAQVGSAAPNYNIRYQVTAFTDDPVQESLPAHVTSTTAASINGGNTERIYLLDTAHGLSTGDVVHIPVGSVVPSIPPGPLNLTLVAQLEGGTFTIEIKDANNFYLDGTDGLVNAGGYDCSYAKAWVEDISRPIPSITEPAELSWTEVEGATEYHIYRALVKAGSPTVPSVYGFIGKSKTGKYSDMASGEDAADTEDTPPVYRNPFTAVNSFPAAVGLFQQRLCFAGTNDHPAKFWLSRTGDLNNFSTRSPLQTDDAVTGEVAMTDVQDIRHFKDGDRLIIFTGGRKCVIEGDSDGSIQPTAINVRAKGGKGGIARPPPLAIESDYLYVDARESIVRNFRLDLVEGQKAADFTTYASHLFGGHLISDWCYQQVPQGTVWAARSDGMLLGLTHAPEQEIEAWHRHDTGGDDDFGWLSVCTIPENGEDMLYGIVGRSAVVPGNVITLQVFSTQYVPTVGGTMIASAALFDGREIPGAIFTLTGADGLTARFSFVNMVTSTQANVIQLDFTPPSLQNTPTLNWTGPHALPAGQTVLQYVERMHLRKMADSDYDVTQDSKFLDSMLTYDGRNPVDSTRSMTLSGSPWGNGSSHTLTSSSAYFAGGAGDVGKKFRLHRFSDYVDVTVTAFGTNLACTVIAMQAVPTNLQGVAVLTWSLLAQTVTGLGHLEDRFVGLLGDGKVLTMQQVDSGSVTVSTPSEIVHVGLPIVAQAKTLPLSAPESSMPPEVLQAAARSITALVKDTSGPTGLTAGIDDGDPSHMSKLEWTPAVQTAAQKAAITAALISGKMRAALISNWEDDGVLVQQTDPLPLVLEAVVLTYEIGGERTG